MNRRDEGSIYRHPDGKRWITRLQYINSEGKRTSKKRTSKSYDLAKVELKKLRQEIELELSDRKRYSQLDAFYRDKYVHEAKFVDGKKLSGFRQSVDTVKMYMDRALEFFKERGDPFLDEIRYSDLEAYKEHIAGMKTQHDRQRSISDINHHLKRVRRLFKKGIEKGWMTVDPFTMGDPLIIESHEAERTRVLSPAEEAKLLEACEKWRKHLRPIIIFAIETGLRRGEIMTLKWSSIDLGRRQLRVESLNSKTLRSRLVPLSGRACEVLTELWRNSRQSKFDLVFGNSDFKKGFNTACDEADLKDVHFHDLRHTAITRWLERGISPAIAMKASGHSQMKTFMRYVNQNADSIMEFAMKLDRAA